MSDRQALNATFFAFKRRERGGVLTAMTLTFLVALIALSGLFFLLNAQGIMDYVAWYGSMMEGAMNGASEPMMPPASVMALGPAYLLLILVCYILVASYEAGALRWMIHGETGGLFGLSFGADTWRVWFTYWVWFFLLIAFYLVVAILMGGVMVAFMSAAGGGADVSSPAGIMLPLLAGLIVVVGLIYFAVRFSPAAATSVARRKFAFFDAWTVTKGRFWALFGAFFLLWLMFVVLYIIAAGVMGFAMASMAMSQVGTTEPQSPQEVFQAFANPQWFAVVVGFVVIMTIAYALLYLGMFGINARAAVAALEEGKIRSEA